MAGQRLRDQPGKLRNLGRAADDIHGLVLEQRIAQPLGHAADDRDDQAGPVLLEMLEMAQIREDPVLRVLPHRAGIDHDGVGLLDAVGQPKTGVLERGGDQAGIQLVHLAAEALDMNGAIFHNNRRIKHLRRESKRDACSTY